MKNLPLAAKVLVAGLMAGLMMAMLPGCRHFHHQPRLGKPLPTSAPTPIVEMEQQALNPVPMHLPVKQGPAPLAMMIDTGGLVKIVDASSGGLIGQTVAPPRSIVSIDDDAGIRIGDQLIVKGPLTPGRTYQIFVDNNSANDNVWRTEVVKPGNSK